MEERNKISMVVPLDKALQKAERYCAYQERCQQEVRDKLYSWGLHKKDVEQTISTLISNGFLKEERFACAFAGGKFRTKKWGRNKIKHALREKKVSEPLIKKALSEIEERDYQKTLYEVLSKQSKKIVEKNQLKKNYKLASYAISRGYESELVWESIKQFAD
jgi:regulatory protein